MTAVLLIIAYLAAGELLVSYLDRRMGGDLAAVYRPCDWQHVLLAWAIWPATLLAMFAEAELARELRDVPHVGGYPAPRSRRPRPLWRSFSRELRFFTRRRTR